MCFTVEINYCECFQPAPIAVVSSAGIPAYVVEPEKVNGVTFGPLTLFGTITEAQAQKMDEAVIASRLDEPSEPLDKALEDLGLS